MMRLALLATSLLSVASSSSVAQGRAAPVIRLVAREYAFTAPRQAPPGLVRVRLVNRGTVPHYARIVRLDSAKTLADVLAWRRAGGRPPTWFVPVGGPAPVSPGDSADAAAVVTPGRHVVICTYPVAGGKSVHIDSGMVRELVVDSVTAADSAAPAVTPNARIADLDADATIVLGEYGYSPLPGLRAGRRQFRVTNAGIVPHQVLLVRLPDTVSDKAEMAWFRDDYETARPGRPSGGLLELPPGETGWFATTLRPGRYLLLCGFADGTTRHFDKGMTRLFDVSS